MRTDGQKWVVDGLIAEGDNSLIIGQPARGMSWIVADMYISVISGSSCLGRFPGSQSAVIWTDEDTPTPMLESGTSKEVNNDV